MIQLIEMFYRLVLNITVNLPSSAHVFPTGMRGGNNNSPNLDDMWLILVIIVLVIVLLYYLATRSEIKPFQFHKQKRNNKTKE